MTEITIEVDDVQEFIMQKVSDNEDISDDEFAQALFDDALWRIYQQWKNGQATEQPEPDPED